MLCVETIGKIRRRRLVKQDSISAIARDLGLSRNTVKRALRFEGRAVRVPAGAPADAEAGAVPRHAGGVARGGREAAGARAAHGAAAATRRCASRATPARSTRAPARAARSHDVAHAGHDGVHPAELRAGRGVPVRLEPRARRAGRRRAGGEGGAPAPVPLPRVLPGGATCAKPRRWCSMRTGGRSALGWHAAARHLRQPQDRGRSDLHGQGSGTTTAGSCRWAATT